MNTMVFFANSKTRDSRKVWAIRRKTLKMILEASKDTYPNEFSAILRANKEGVITEIMLLPGTLSGDHSSILRLHMLPIDFSVVGIIHSHPSTSNIPSEQDEFLFQKFGHTHIITCYPYNETAWTAYDHNGNIIKLQVVD